MVESPAGWPVMHPESCEGLLADHSLQVCPAWWLHTALNHVRESSVAYNLDSVKLSLLVADCLDGAAEEADLSLDRSQRTHPDATNVMLC